MNEFGSWDDFIATANRQGFAFKDLLGQFRDPLDISRGGSIKFPATQKPSTDPNTLDDYEEGTWTPTLMFGGVTTGITYTTRLGTYTKVGRYVHAAFSILLSSKGAAAGNALISGLPFTCSNTMDLSGSIGYWGSMTSSFVTLNCYAQAGGVEIVVFGATAGATSLTQLANTDYANTTDLKGSVSFHV